MSALWQNVLVALAVVSAVVYLVVLLVRRRKNRPACSECRLLQAAIGRPPDKSGRWPPN